MCASMSSEQKIEQLVQSFPSLRGALGTQPWDALEFDAWACDSGLSHGTLCAARFVLSVWDPGAKWRSGRFDLAEALHCWDFDHHTAFVRWAAKPWWP